MITYDMIIDAQSCIVKNWEEDGKKVIEEIAKIAPFTGTAKDYLTNYCIACGGNWGGMLLTGIQTLYPKGYDAIPDDMGVNAWSCICSVLILCGVDTSE